MEGEREEEEVGRGGRALTVRCRHQGLELLGLGWRLWPGAGSHGDLGSSGRPAAKKQNKRREKLVNKCQQSTACTCMAHWLDVWGQGTGARQSSCKRCKHTPGHTSANRTRRACCLQTRVARCTVECTLTIIACANCFHSVAAGAVPSSKSTWIFYDPSCVGNNRLHQHPTQRWPGAEHFHLDYAHLQRPV